MEDPQMTELYRTMARRWFAAVFHRVWRRGVMRSGMVTGLILAAIVGGLSFAYREQGRGHVRRIKARIEPVRRDEPVTRPGGQDAIELTRMRLLGSSMPEFLSVTMLPGRGMNVLQIGAFIPGKGEVNLLASPPVEGADRAMTGSGADVNGQQSLSMGGAFEVPWAGRMWGVEPQISGRLNSAGHGHAISLPGGAQSGSNGGLMLQSASDSADTTAFPDGGEAQAVYHAESFDTHWISKTDVTITVLLSSRTVEITVVARNVGDVPEPVGIGWSPRFAIFDGNREQLRLHLPCDRREEVRDRKSGMPTGTLLPVAGSAYDFTARGGVPLGRIELDDTFLSPPRREAMDSDPVAELTDPANDYGLRLTAFSPDIKAFRVDAPADADFVSIAPQYNYDDPFGREWGANPDTGMVVLQPGQSTQWKVRLEIFSLGSSQSPL